MQLAYPSVRLSYLREQIQSMLSPTLQKEIKNKTSWLSEFGPMSWDDALRNYPEEVKTLLVEPATQKQLVSVLLNSLASVRYESERQTPDATWSADLWKPPHTIQELPLGSGASHPGLPTGLAISGMLMNAYLHTLDRTLCQHSKPGKNRPGFAMLRFADDLILMSSSREGLANAVDAAWLGLSGKQNGAVLATQHPTDVPSNLWFNWSKTKPDALANGITIYLQKNGALAKCKSCNQPLPPEKPSATLSKPPSFFSWLEAQIEAGDTNWLPTLNKERLQKESLGQFVTYLVERLSALGSEGLQNRFGDDAIQRLTNLHELARFDLGDLQVKEETRLSFAASQLARAWLSEDSSDSDRLQLQELRRSIAHAMKHVPWKFQLWRAVIHAAVRRPLGCSDLPSGEDDIQAAQDWLISLLGQLVPDTEAGDAIISTAACWSQEEGTDWTDEQIQKRLLLIRDGFQSFARASFWRQLADTLHQLARATQEIESDGDRSTRIWTSASWLFRALPQQEVANALRWLGSIDTWANVLYPEGQEVDLPSWEVDGLTLAILAASSRSEIHQNWPQLAPRRARRLPEWNDPLPLAIPRALPVLIANPVSRRLLRWRWAQERQRQTMWHQLHALPITCLGHASDADSQVFTADIARTIPGDSDAHHSAHALRVLRELGVWHPLFSSSLQRRLGNEAEGLLQAILSLELSIPTAETRSLNWLKLGDYHVLRQQVSAARQKPGSSNIPLTLYSILWGNHWDRSSSERLVPESAPILGLPLRISMHLLREALNALPKPSPSTIKPSRKILQPTAWKFSIEGEKAISQGRRQQFDSTIEVKLPNSRVQWLSSPAPARDWEVLPHALYLYPFAMGVALTEAAYALICNVFQFWTAIDGSERILNSLLEQGLGPLSFEERWDLRDRHHLPNDFWTTLEEIVRSALLRRAAFIRSASHLSGQLSKRITKLIKPAIRSDDFRWERADILLDSSKGQEAPVHVSSFLPGNLLPVSDPPELAVNGKKLIKSITVRIAQASAEPNWQDFHNTFPREISRAERQLIMRQLKSALRKTENCVPTTGADQSFPSTKPDIIILPEVVLPRSERKQIQELVSSMQVAVLCGKIFSELPTVFPSKSRQQRRERWLVNEADLFFPVQAEEDSGPPLVRRFSIRKPLLSHMERALADTLSERPPGKTHWRMLAGRRWYRFVHENWGDFTVAICSDIIDPSPWWSLRAQVLHIFMSAHNPDIELFDSLTRIRSYENFCNVVSSNHGVYGGSVAWTPKSGHDRELARLHGGKLFLLADVQLPVAPLFKQQQVGLSEALLKEKKSWLSQSPGKSSFKSPPPTYPGRGNKT
ncbi:hypothetical protein [Corallococcus sp. AB038B]|uniref:hypothetical protein n=1 Tax=Corallococcus sp. AB038B TaxID=2316718 RepID=UPI0011C39AD8|nr:hypothetical protein [Corallococcus sp. AB038B]